MKKVMVITGGSDGLGKSIAEKLAQNEENEVVILSNQQGQTSVQHGFRRDVYIGFAVHTSLKG